MAGSSTQKASGPFDVDVVVHPTHWSRLNGLDSKDQAALLGAVTLQDVIVGTPVLSYVPRIQPVVGALDAFICQPGEENHWEQTLVDRDGRQSRPHSRCSQGLRGGELVSFRDMATRIGGEDFASRLARMSAQAAAAKFEPQPPAPFIRVDFTAGLPDAYALGRTIEQVHTATAQAAKWIRARSASPVTRADRARVELIPRAAGPSIFFRLPGHGGHTRDAVPRSNGDPR